MILKTVAIITVIVVLKWLWVTISTMGHGTFEGEKTEILRRKNYLTNKLLVSPEEVLNEMPGGIGTQFQGEWAMYSCSMLSAALTNISILYPDERENTVEQIDRLIEIVMSPELREYDAARWDEDPLESWDSKKSHMSYLSILAWMISGYKTAGGDDKYDDLYYRLCSTLNWRMRESPTLNLQTYPNEAVYVPDMLVTLVALSNFTWQCDDRYQATVKEWLEIWMAEYLFGVKPRTASIYTNDIVHYIIPALGAIRLEALNAHTKNSNFIKLAMRFRGLDFATKVIKKLENCRAQIFLDSHLAGLHRKGLIALDDYSLAIL